MPLEADEEVLDLLVMQLKYMENFPEQRNHADWDLYRADRFLYKHSATYRGFIWCKHRATQRSSSL